MRSMWTDTVAHLQGEFRSLETSERGQGRPLGLIMAWLLQHKCCPATEHKQIKVPDLSDGVAARRHFIEDCATGPHANPVALEIVACERAIEDGFDQGPGVEPLDL